MNNDSPASEPVRFRLTGSEGDHGVGREILCSLPRSIACRLCQGEKDCPYIVERPLGRLIVRKREPVSLVVRDLVHVSTGSENTAGTSAPVRQWVVALLSWMAIPALIAWVVFVHHPNYTNLIFPGIVMATTFVLTIVGVPIVRWFWLDHGGKRRGGPWRPA